MFNSISREGYGFLKQDISYALSCLDCTYIVHCTGLPPKLQNPTAVQRTHLPSSSICAATYVTVTAAQLLLAHIKLCQLQAA
jgi:hypothetical protein